MCMPPPHPRTRTKKGQWESLRNIVWRADHPCTECSTTTTTTTTTTRTREMHGTAHSWGPSQSRALQRISAEMGACHLSIALPASLFAPHWPALVCSCMRTFDRAAGNRRRQRAQSSGRVAVLSALLPARVGAMPIAETEWRPRMERYAATGQWQRAVTLLHTVRQAGGELRPGAYQAVITACARSEPPAWRAALGILDELPPDTASHKYATSHSCRA